MLNNISTRTLVGGIIIGALVAALAIAVYVGKATKKITSKADVNYRGCEQGDSSVPPTVISGSSSSNDVELHYECMTLTPAPVDCHLLGWRKVAGVDEGWKTASLYPGNTRHAANGGRGAGLVWIDPAPDPVYDDVPTGAKHATGFGYLPDPVYGDKEVAVLSEDYVHKEIVWGIKDSSGGIMASSAGFGIMQKPAGEVTFCYPPAPTPTPTPTP